MKTKKLTECSVISCNNIQKFKPNLIFHRFPPNNHELCTLWLKAINRENWTPRNYSKICSDHFLESDYEKSFLKYGQLIKLLKKDAVPSQFLVDNTSFPRLENFNVKNRVNIRCCVTKCNNSSQETRDLTFHPFPTDPDLIRVWVQKINNPALLDMSFNVFKYMRICGPHFKLIGDPKSETVNEDINTDTIEDTNYISVHEEVLTKHEDFSQDGSEKENMACMELLDQCLKIENIFSLNPTEPEISLQFENSSGDLREFNTSELEQKAHYDFECMCRICLTGNKILHTFLDRVEENVIRDMLIFCSRNQISDEDMFPKKICANCAEELQKSYLFLRKYEEATKKLQNYCQKQYEASRGSIIEEHHYGRYDSNEESQNCETQPEDSKNLTIVGGSFEKSGLNSESGRNEKDKVNGLVKEKALVDLEKKRKKLSVTTLPPMSLNIMKKRNCLSLVKLFSISTDGSNSSEASSKGFEESTVNSGPGEGPLTVGAPDEGFLPVRSDSGGKFSVSKSGVNLGPSKHSMLIRSKIFSRFKAPNSSNTPVNDLDPLRLDSTSSGIFYSSLSVSKSLNPISSKTDGALLGFEASDPVNSKSSGAFVPSAPVFDASTTLELQSQVPSKISSDFPPSFAALKVFPGNFSGAFAVLGPDGQLIQILSGFEAPKSSDISVSNSKALNPTPGTPSGPVKVIRSLPNLLRPRNKSKPAEPVPGSEINLVPQGDWKKLESSHQITLVPKIVELKTVGSVPAPLVTPEKNTTKTGLVTKTGIVAKPAVRALTRLRSAAIQKPENQPGFSLKTGAIFAAGNTEKKAVSVPGSASESKEQSRVLPKGVTVVRAHKPTILKRGRPPTRLSPAKRIKSGSSKIQTGSEPKNSALQEVYLVAQNLNQISKNSDPIEDPLKTSLGVNTSAEKGQNSTLGGNIDSSGLEEVILVEDSSRSPTPQLVDPDIVPILPHENSDESEPLDLEYFPEDHEDDSGEEIRPCLSENTSDVEINALNPSPGDVNDQTFHPIHVAAPLDPAKNLQKTDRDEALSDFDTESESSQAEVSSLKEKKGQPLNPPPSIRVAASPDSEKILQKTDKDKALSNFDTESKSSQAEVSSLEEKKGQPLNPPQGDLNDQIFSSIRVVASPDPKKILQKTNNNEVIDLSDFDNKSKSTQVGVSSSQEQKGQPIKRPEASNATKQLILVEGTNVVSSLNEKLENKLAPKKIVMKSKDISGGKVSNPILESPNMRLKVKKVVMGKSLPAILKNTPVLTPGNLQSVDPAQRTTTDPSGSGNFNRKTPILCLGSKTALQPGKSFPKINPSEIIDLTSDKKTISHVAGSRKIIMRRKILVKSSSLVNLQLPKNLAKNILNTYVCKKADVTSPVDSSKINICSVLNSLQGNSSKMVAVKRTGENLVHSIDLTQTTPEKPTSLSLIREETSTTNASPFQSLDPSQKIDYSKNVNSEKEKSANGSKTVTSQNSSLPSIVVLPQFANLASAAPNQVIFAPLNLNGSQNATNLKYADSKMEISKVVPENNSKSSTDTKAVFNSKEVEIQPSNSASDASNVTPNASQNSLEKRDSEIEISDFLLFNSSKSSTPKRENLNSENQTHSLISAPKAPNQLIFAPLSLSGSQNATSLKNADSGNISKNVVFNKGTSDLEEVQILPSNSTLVASNKQIFAPIIVEAVKIIGGPKTSDSSFRLGKNSGASTSTPRASKKHTFAPITPESFKIFGSPIKMESEKKGPSFLLGNNSKSSAVLPAVLKLESAQSQSLIFPAGSSAVNPSLTSTAAVTPETSRIFWCPIKMDSEKKGPSFLLGNNSKSSAVLKQESTQSQPLISPAGLSAVNPSSTSNAAVTPETSRIFSGPIKMDSEKKGISFLLGNNSKSSAVLKQESTQSQPLISPAGLSAVNPSSTSNAAVTPETSRIFSGPIKMDSEKKGPSFLLGNNSKSSAVLPAVLKPESAQSQPLISPAGSTDANPSDKQIAVISNVGGQSQIQVFSDQINRPTAWKIKQNGGNSSIDKKLLNIRLVERGKVPASLNLNKSMVIGKAYRCKTCNEIFFNKKRMFLHNCFKKNNQPTLHLPKNALIKIPGKVYQCKNCKKQFTSLQELVQHQRTVSHPGRRGPRPKMPHCKKCKLDFDTISDLKRHRRKAHISEKNLKLMKEREERKARRRLTCAKCNSEFQDMKELKTHKKEVHLGEVVNCPVCQKSVLAGSLTMHKNGHSQDPKYCCEYCGKRFRSHGNFVRHYNFHRGITPYHCDICGRGFRSNVRKSEHRLTHFSERKYICESCGKTFRQRGGLETHRRKNRCFKGRGESQPRKCTVCGEEFKTHKELKSHKRLTHDPQITPDYSCDICNLKFSTRSAFINHELIHTERKFICEECRRPFYTQERLDRHRITHVAGNFVCEVCGKGFAQKMGLTTHMSVHTGARPIACTMCPKTFSQSAHLTSHMRTHTGDKPFVCLYCGKAFALNGNLTVHMRLHTGERPYKCSACGAAFYDSGGLKKHLAREHGSHS